MKDLKFVKRFVFEFAEYHLSDGEGDETILKINYKNNKYCVECIGKITNQDFMYEVNEIAKSLLKRKSGINRARAIKL